MAMKRNSQLEREFYYRKLGVVRPLIPLNQLARNYFLSYLGANAGSNTAPLEQLEAVWAKQYIRDNGGTPPSGNYPSQLWRQLVVVIGKGGFVSKNIQENKSLFYLYAP